MTQCDGCLEPKNNCKCAKLPKCDKCGVVIIDPQYNAMSEGVNEKGEDVRVCPECYYSGR